MKKEILATLKAKNIVVLDDFLTKETCKQMLGELKFSLWGRSSVVQYIGDEEAPAYFSDIRKSKTSGQIWFSDELNAELEIIETRLADVLGTSEKKFEEWQATRYGKNDSFDYHVDCGNWKKSAAGERKRTFLLYLDTPAIGGGTHFRGLDMMIKAQAGRLVIWNNLLPGGNCNFGMIHSGLPVEKGRKTILVSWERMRNLRN